MEFKLGDRVKHKVKPEFDMLVIDFEKGWDNDLSRFNEPNPAKPICKYYNIHTNEWEIKGFAAIELEKIEYSI